MRLPNLPNPNDLSQRQSYLANNSRQQRDAFDSDDDLYTLADGSETESTATSQLSRRPPSRADSSASYAANPSTLSRARTPAPQVASSDQNPKDILNSWVGEEFNGSLNEIISPISHSIADIFCKMNGTGQILSWQIAELQSGGGSWRQTADLFDFLSKGNATQRQAFIEILRSTPTLEYLLKPELQQPDAVPPQPPRQQIPARSIIPAAPAAGPSYSSRPPFSSLRIGPDPHSYSYRPIPFAPQSQQRSQQAHQYGHSGFFGSAATSPRAYAPLAPVAAAPSEPVLRCNPDSLFYDILNPEFDSSVSKTNSFKVIFKENYENVAKKMALHIDDIFCAFDANEYGLPANIRHSMNNPYNQAKALIVHWGSLYSHEKMIKNVYKVLSNIKGGGQSRNVSAPSAINPTNNQKEKLKEIMNEKIGPITQVGSSGNKWNTGALQVFFKPGLSHQQIVNILALNIDAILKASDASEFPIHEKVKWEKTPYDRAAAMAEDWQAYAGIENIMKKNYEVLSKVANGYLGENIQVVVARPELNELDKSILESILKTQYKFSGNFFRDIFNSDNLTLPEVVSIIAPYANYIIQELPGGVDIKNNTIIAEGGYQKAEALFNYLDANGWNEALLRKTHQILQDLSR